VLTKYLGPFREFGAGAGLLYAIDRVLSGVSPRLRLHFYELMAQPIPDTPLLPARFLRNVEVREIKRGDPEVDLMPARPEIKESRFEQQAICLGAFMKSEFIGYMWFCYRRYDEDEVRCTFVLSPPDTAVFDFDFYLFPAHRLGLGFAALWHGANTYLRDRGITVTFSRLTRYNIASRRAHAHLGWTRVGRAFFLTAWGLQAMISTISPYVNLSIRESGRARLALGR
jgi:hypothetical protein